MLRLKSGHPLPAGVSRSSSSSASSSFWIRRNSLQFSGGYIAPSLSIIFERRGGLRRRRAGDWFIDSSNLCCKASLGSSSGSSGNSSERWDEEDQFLQASLLVSETVKHYFMRKRGFLEENRWQSFGRTHPLSLHSKILRSDISPLGHGFLRRFHSPTFFLKIACEGDLILPIVVGEFAIEKLMDTLRDVKTEECPNQFQFVKNLVGILGYEVKKVWITKRVVNTYYAQIFLGKTADMANICLDSRPSDAIHVANGFKAPIYVSKEIVLKDAIQVLYGTQRKDASKTVFDVSLDSAAEGPDLLAEELDLVRKMNTAVLEERYKDAAVWRDKLNKLRMPRPES